ncbi:uncharacterized protein LOC122047761 [Zingiber officinale]|uniref:DEUBAD domain-containing protein n=1 Tax=Zingiber officinale TaxID=94328 RepID=A0A8J5LXE1_ZINOF|nr:uncharacterized protein LOC122047761 [Zingiber officinale]KAG6526576.1 hypothetical protein ZIOFF_016567 [Zingiber officinale]
MAILKNASRVLRTGGGSPPQSASSQEEYGELSAGIGKSESYASEASYVDSGMETDECDRLELGDPGAQLCQVGNQSFFIPLELFDLPDLGSILSLETWNEYLTEEERFALSGYLPDMDQETFGITLKELFSGENFHFGSPPITLFSQLKGGLCDPNIILYRRGLVSLQWRDHYHCLHSYQNSMVRSLVSLKDAFQSCAGYSIQERIQFLNTVKRQRPLERNEDASFETNSEEVNMDRLYSSYSSKASRQFLKPSTDIKLRDIGMGREPVIFGKGKTKGVLKVTTSKFPAQESASSAHSSSLKYGMSSKYKAKIPQLPVTAKDKYTGFHLESPPKTMHYTGEDQDDMEEEYVIPPKDWKSGHRSIATSSLFRIGKNEKSAKRHDVNIYSDEEPADYSSFSHSWRKNGNAHHMVTIASYGDESPEKANKARNFERELLPSTTGETQNLMMSRLMRQNKFHEDSILPDHFLKLDGLNHRATKWNIKHEYGTGDDGVDYNLKSKSFRTFPTQTNDVYLHNDHRIRNSHRKMKNNLNEVEDMSMNYSRITTMAAQSEETESETSDQVGNGGSTNPMIRNLRFRGADTEPRHSSIVKSTYDYEKHDELIDEDRKCPSTFPDVDRHVYTPDIDSYSVKIKCSKSVKKGIRQDTSEKLKDAEKKRTRMVNMDHSSQQSFYAVDYRGGMMDEHLDNLDEISKLQGSNSKANRLGNTAKFSDSQSMNANSETSGLPLKGCNSASKKPKWKVNNGHYPDEPDDSLYLKKPSAKQQKGKRKVVAETDTLTAVSSDLGTSKKDAEDVEPKPKLQKKPFTLITPSIHTGFSFSIVHLLSAVRKAMITHQMDDSTFNDAHLQNRNCSTIQITKELNEMGLIENNKHLAHSVETMVNQASFPSLAFQEIVERVRSNPGDPCILETREPLQDLVRGALKIFSSKTAPLGVKGWKPLILHDKLNKSWLWTGPISSGLPDNENAEEEISSEAWGIPYKMLVKLVDAFANWLKSSQETLQQIGSLPPPPTSLLSNLDEKERFKDLRAQKSLNTIGSSSTEVRAYFRREEFLRYSVPDRAFSYTAADGRKSIVAPLKRGGGKPTSKARDHFMLKPDRPPHVTILCLVRDAAARLPGSIGTRADVCTLLRDSQYVVENVSDTQVTQIVSGALDRLHYERDPCVQFDSERKLWVYLHREREEEDFEDDGTSSTKKWKRQRKDLEIGNDVDTGSLAVCDFSTGLDHDHNLNVGTTSFGSGEIAEHLNEDMGVNVENFHSLMDTNIVSEGNSNWNSLGLNLLNENRLVCQKNSTDEDYNDETFCQERPVQLHYDHIMNKGLY